MSRLVAIAVALLGGACATASSSAGSDAGTDAGVGRITLSQSASLDASAGGSFACQQTNFTRENSYYRVFSLQDLGIGGRFEVESVTFAVESAVAGGGAMQQPAQLKLGRYTGAPGAATLDLTLVLPVAGKAISIADTSAPTLVTTPLPASIPAGSNVIVELAVPDGLSAQNVLYLGANSRGETKPAYFRAPGCGRSTPTDMSQVATQSGLGEVHLILTVTGVAG